MLTKEQLLALLGNHEDNFVERKSEGVKDAELRQTVVAFANTVPEGRDAALFIGIDDKSGEIVGVTNPDQLQKRIRSVCEGDCYPAIAYTSEVIPADGKPVVAVVIPPSERKPHFAGPAYVRVGSESRKASEEQFEELILSRIDKCRALLGLKNQVVTVRGVGYKLGSHKPLPDAAYAEAAECRVLACDAHSVRLQMIGSDRMFSEPLQHVQITRDEERYRPMLIVTFPRR